MLLTEATPSCIYKCLNKIQRVSTERTGNGSTFGKGSAEILTCPAGRQEPTEKGKPL